jgi:hypothetical protein
MNSMLGATVATVLHLILAENISITAVEAAAALISQDIHHLLNQLLAVKAVAEMEHHLIETLDLMGEEKMVKLIPVVAVAVAFIPAAAHHKVDRAARELLL